MDHEGSPPFRAGLYHLAPEVATPITTGTGNPWRRAASNNAGTPVRSESRSEEEGLMRPLFLLLPLIGVAAGAPVLQAQRDSSGASYENRVQPFLSRHCTSCHNAK